MKTGKPSIFVCLRKCFCQDKGCFCGYPKKNDRRQVRRGKGRIEACIFASPLSYEIDSVCGD